MFIKNCYKCDIAAKRKNIVNGYGDKLAKLMIIGESPGYHEDKAGLPFVGKSGKHLNKYFKLFDIQRPRIYITNAIKCQPIDSPTEIELRNCKPYLLSEIREIKPKIIVLLGRYAHRQFYGKYQNISQVRLKWNIINDIYIITSYHPSYLVRNEHEPKIALDDWNMIANKYHEIDPVI